ncbi:RNA-directed DNA polymerase from mobile element jockey [Trichonephila clavipes]|nr:RNA-directed DNA polymerase from mobile element jockey [Trichonephila clavipes]
MSKISPFAIHKMLIGIGGEPKSVKRLRSVDLLIETTSALQTKTFLLAKSFLNNPVTVSPHKSLNSCRGVISEPDLLGTPDSVRLEGFSDQSVTQCLPSPRHLHLLKKIYTSFPICNNTNNTKCESLLKIPIPTTTTTTSPGNNLNTSVSSLETETRSLTTPDKFNALSTEILPESVPTTSNSEHSNAAEIPQLVKRNSRNRRKRPKVQKPEIEIKMASHRPRKAAPTESTTDDEDMITYYVEEEELEQDPANKFTIKDPLNFPKGYLRSLTPSRNRNSRGSLIFFLNNMYCLTLF